MFASRAALPFAVGGHGQEDLVQPLLTVHAYVMICKHKVKGWGVWKGEEEEEKEERVSQSVG